MERPSKFIQLIRPINCTMMGFAVIVGALLAESEGFPSAPLRNLLLGFLTAFTLTGASMAINDYYDREIDAVNEPDRPIPSGVIKPGEALVFASILSVTGFVAAFVTNISCLIIAVIAWLVFIAYTTKGKRTGLPGNFLVSLCIVIPFLYGGFAVANWLELGAPMRIALFAAMAFFSNTGREVTKGIVDVMGDKSKGVRTVAIVHGEKVAAIVALIFNLSAVGLTPIPWLLQLVSPYFLPFVVLTDVGLIFCSFSLLRDYSRQNARKTKNTVLVWFITGLLAFVAGTFG